MTGTIGVTASTDVSSGAAAGVARDLAQALDPVLLARRCGLEPDPWQRDVLRSTAPRLLLNCSRQSGKSTTTAVLAVHLALYEPGALVLLLSPSLRQSQELFRKCADLYAALERPVPAEAETALRLELASGARIVALPGRDPATVRGYSGVRLLIIDEAAQVADELYASVRPMLAVSGGRLIALSTPFGKRGWWYEAWAHGGAAWERVRVPATDCPRIAPDFLAQERRALPAWWYDQEYGCEFREALDQLFGDADLRAALDPALAPLWPADPADPGDPAGAVATLDLEGPGGG